MFIDKLSYTKNEKIAEIAGIITLGAFELTYIVLMLAKILSGFSVVMVVISALSYGGISVASAYPQNTNLVKESTTEQDLHKIRRDAIAGKIILVAVMFGMSTFPLTVISY